MLQFLNVNSVLAQLFFISQEPTPPSGRFINIWASASSTLTPRIHDWAGSWRLKGSEKALVAWMEEPLR